MEPLGTGNSYPLDSPGIFGSRSPNIPPTTQLSGLRESRGLELSSGLRCEAHRGMWSGRPWLSQHGFEVQTFLINLCYELTPFCNMFLQPVHSLLFRLLGRACAKRFKNDTPTASFLRALLPLERRPKRGAKSPDHRPQVFRPKADLPRRSSLPNLGYLAASIKGSSTSGQVPRCVQRQTVFSLRFSALEQERQRQMDRMGRSIAGGLEADSGGPEAWGGV